MKTQRRFEIKEIPEQGQGYFEGLLSPYGNVDQGGDIVEPGAYTKTLKDLGPNRPILYQHKTDTPIGQLTLEDRADGLWCKGQLLLALTKAQDAYLLIKNGIVTDLSIGFEAIKDSVENGVRHLKEIKLYEGSIVTFGMNPMAKITAVKSRQERKGDFAEELSEIQVSDARYQLQQALSCALNSVIWAEATGEEKIAMSASILQQFVEAWTLWFPGYLDMLAEMYGAMETWNDKRIETKSGRKISAATKEQLKTAHEHTKTATECMKAAGEIMSALYGDEADGDESTSKSAKPGSPVTSTPGAAEPKPEPVVDHSAALSLIGNIKALIPA